MEMLIYLFYEKAAILAFSGKEPANVLHKNKPPRQESLFYPIAGIGAFNGGLKALEHSPTAGTGRELQGLCHRPAPRIGPDEDHV